MNESQPKSTNRRWFRMPAIVALTMLGLTIGFYIRTFSRSEDITLFDVSFFADECLVTFNIPLTRLTREGKCISRVRFFERGKQSWNSGTTYPGTTIRSPMRTLIDDRQVQASLTSDPFVDAGSSVVPAKKSGRNFFVLADFGYRRGDWQSEHRPGPSITMFVPVWFAGLNCYILFLLLYFRRFRFGIRTLVGLMIVVAVFIWATHLRMPT